MTSCSHQHKKIYRRYLDFDLMHCCDCHLVFINQNAVPVPAKELYANYYKNELPSRFGFGLEQVVKWFRLYRAYKVTTVMPTARTVLDIGCGRGFTLYFLKKHFGFSTVVGTQIVQNAVRFAREKLNLLIYDQDLLDINFGSEKFDLVTIWHVLEHVLKPEEYIARIRTLLNENGMALFEVPNYNAWSRKLTGRYWLSLDPKYHVTFFTPSSLCSLLEKHGFRIRMIHTHSLEYSTFTSAQSLVSLFTHTDQLFFHWLQRPGANWRIILHGVLLMFLAPLCFVINLFLYFSLRGEVLLVVAEKMRADKDKDLA
jgi:2-polyprenyl-3-methyl-5-hydroxy-6-metoxy-1,4-benzoquinol methylase